MSEKVRRVYNDHARNAAPGDFWTQSARTIRGVPVGEDQIALIVEAVAGGLELAPDDTVIDLCCGNGALSDRLFDRARGGVGVDFAEQQIEIAQRAFAHSDKRRYVLDDVGHFVETTADAARFTKGLSYGAFSFLAESEVVDILRSLHERFVALERFYVGNLPDRDALHAFFYPGAYVPGIEDDHESPIGLWWTKEGFVQVAERAGWAADVRVMPPAFYAAHYRFDAVLRR